MEPCDFWHGQKQSSQAGKDTGFEYKQAGTKDSSLNTNEAPGQTITMSLQRLLLALKQLLLHDSLNWV